MFFDSVLELYMLISIGFVLIATAAAINRRADWPVENLSREDVLLRTLQEVDEVFAWYQGQLSPDDAICIGCCYARYSTKYQDSIAAQIKKILEHAARLKIYVPREYIFFDTAVSGRKRRREGLSQVEATLQAKKCRALLLFGTNRLFRKTYAALEFADRVHKGLGYSHCICLAEHRYRQH
jgi:hypothetical protein